MADSTEYQYQGLRRSIYDSEALRQALTRHLGLTEITGVTVEHEAIDARRKPNIFYLYHVRFTVSRVTPRLESLISQGKVAVYTPPMLPPAERRLRLPEQPIIVGFGPAGMFLGLELARLGYKPVIFERGEPVEERVRSVQALWGSGVLDPNSNLQFGEGGAGTFSDGKLTTGKRRDINDLVLQTLVQAGAPDRILYQNKPHIGTDYLRVVVTNVRKEIESLGGEVHFGHTLTGLTLEGGAVSGVQVNGRLIRTRWAALAIGHSARDTTTMLFRQGVAMEAKPFAVGVRIEHPASFINELQYGKEAASVLPSTDYKLTCRHNDLAVFSFCACPGGRVVCAASEPDGLVVNGMSFSRRDEEFTNSALVVSVEPARYGFKSPLEAIEFQNYYEQRAFAGGGGRYFAPAQWAVDFMNNRLSTNLPETSYRPGVAPADLNGILPPDIVPALKAGLHNFDKTMPGFIDRGILIGFESRTSSPGRIVRSQDCESVSTPGLVVLGEGAGYAGGIMTCALDALNYSRLVRPFGE